MAVRGLFHRRLCRQRVPPCQGAAHSASNAAPWWVGPGRRRGVLRQVGQDSYLGVGTDVRRITRLRGIGSEIFIIKIINHHHHHKHHHHNHQQIIPKLWTQTF